MGTTCLVNGQPCAKQPQEDPTKEFMTVNGTKTGHKA